MVFHQFILCSAHLGPCEKWVIDHVDEADQELLPKNLTKSKATNVDFTEEQILDTWVTSKCKDIYMQI